MYETVTRGVEDIRTVTPYGVQDTFVPVNIVQDTYVPGPPAQMQANYGAPMMQQMPPQMVTAGSPMTMAAPQRCFSAAAPQPQMQPQGGMIMETVTRGVEDIRTVTPYGVQDTFVPVNIVQDTYIPGQPAMATNYGPPMVQQMPPQMMTAPPMTMPAQMPQQQLSYLPPAPVTTMAAPQPYMQPQQMAPQMMTAQPMTMPAPMPQQLSYIPPAPVTSMAAPQYMPAPMPMTMPAQMTVAAPPQYQQYGSPGVFTETVTRGVEDIRTVTPYGVTDTFVPVNIVQDTFTPAAQPQQMMQQPMTMMSPGMHMATPAQAMTMAAPAQAMPMMRQAMPMTAQAHPMHGYQVTETVTQGYEDIRTVTPYGVQDTIVPVNFVQDTYTAY